MWPTPQDYNEAIQNPALAFDDAELQSGIPETTSLGLPKPRSGSFASVYHLQGGGRDWAVRCFLHHFGDQQQRYEEIGQFLARHPLAYMVDFHFLPRGIFIHDQWFPILKMAWVNGQQLNDWIESHCDDADSLERIRDRFVELCHELSVAGIAHGDLQHGNILVVGDKLKLVDYDGIYLEALSALGSNELGHRNYQHPERSRDHFANHLDRFSAWSIYTSLYCLARDPLLWHRLAGGDECLLFRHQDYKSPEQSTAFRILEHHELPEVRRCARQLRRLLQLPLEQLPPLGEPVDGAEALPDLEPPSKLPDWLAGHLESSTSEASPAPQAMAGSSLLDPAQSNAPSTARGRAAGELLNNMAEAVSGKNSLTTQPSSTVNEAAGWSLAGNRPIFFTGPPADASRSLPSNVALNSKNQPVGTATGSGGSGSANLRPWLKLLTPKPLLLFAVFMILAGALLFQIGYSTFLFRPEAGGKSDSGSSAGFSLALDRGKAAFADARKLAGHSDYPAAIVRFQQAFTEFEQTNSEHGMAACAYQIGRCYGSMHDDAQAISWMEKAISRFHAESYSPTILSDLGSLYLNHQELDRAAYYLAQSLQTTHHTDNETGDRVAKALRELGVTLLKREDPQGLEAYDAALTYEENRRIRDPVSYFQELRDAAKILEQRKNLPLAFAAWRRAYDVTLEYPGSRHTQRIEALHALSRIATSQGNFDTAKGCEDRALELERTDHLNSNSQTPLNQGQDLSRSPSPTVPNPRRKPDPTQP
jgi:tetratricopeptide (TPR) repeat protein